MDRHSWKRNTHRRNDELKERKRFYSIIKPTWVGCTLIFLMLPRRAQHDVNK